MTGACFEDMKATRAYGAVVLMAHRVVVGLLVGSCYSSDPAARRAQIALLATAFAMLAGWVAVARPFLVAAANFAECAIAIAQATGALLHLWLLDAPADAPPLGIAIDAESAFLQPRRSHTTSGCCCCCCFGRRGRPLWWPAAGVVLSVPVVTAEMAAARPMAATVTFCTCARVAGPPQ